MPEIKQITDATGKIRRLGLLIPDPALVRSIRTTSPVMPEWTDAQIKRHIADQQDIREIFGDEWICDQLIYGSCAGWGTAACQARARYWRGIIDGITRFSGSYVYGHVNNNRDAGSLLVDCLAAIQQHGAPPESLVPADKIYRRQMPPGADAEAAKHKGYRCTPIRNTQQLKTALARRIPCLVAVHAGRGYQALDANGISGVDNGPGNHAVCCDSLKFLSGRFYADHAGSWGLRSFRRGRSLLRMEAFTQTIGPHLFWAMVSTEEAEKWETMEFTSLA